MSKISPENGKPVLANWRGGLKFKRPGVVFGDIGTSPLYTLKTVLNLTGANPDAATTLGALSLFSDLVRRNNGQICQLRDALRQ